MTYYCTLKQPVLTGTLTVTGICLKWRMRSFVPVKWGKQTLPSLHRMSQFALDTDLTPRLKLILSKSCCCGRVLCSPTGERKSPPQKQIFKAGLLLNFHDCGITAWKNWLWLTKWTVRLWKMTLNKWSLHYLHTFQTSSPVHIDSFQKHKTAWI